MTKPGFFDDTFEKLVELGTSTGKKTTQALTQTFSPLKLAEKIFNQNEGQNSQSPNQEIRNKDKNHTPINFEELRKKYADQDRQKETALKHRLFQLVKQGEAQVLQEQKQEEEKKKLSEQREKEEKETQRKQKQEQELIQEIPKGKVRRSIFSPKKMVKKQHPEIKPSIGKQ